MQFSLFKLLTFVIGSTLLVFTVGCGRLNTAISQSILDCGSDASKNIDYIQVIDPNGSDVTGEQLYIRNSDQLEIKATSHGCFPRAALESEDLIISSKLKNRIWGTIANQMQITLFSKIVLKDQSSLDLKLNCLDMQYTNGQIAHPYEISKDEKIAFPAIVFLSGSKIVQNQSLNPVEDFQFTGSMPDGKYDVTVSYKNLYRVDDLDKDKSVICSYILDRTAPIIKNSFRDLYKDGVYRANPGERITLSEVDANPRSLHYCLAEMNSSQECLDDARFLSAGAELSIQAPNGGKWCLSYWAEDLAGNRSSTERSCFLAYQGSVIGQINSLMQTADSRLNIDPLNSAINVLKANSLLETLPTEEEKSEVESKVNSLAISVLGRSSELNRILSSTGFSDQIAWGDRLMSSDNEKFELRDSRGNIIDTLQSTGIKFLLPDHKFVLTALAGELTLFRVNAKFEKAGKIIFNSESLIRTVGISPDETNVLIADGANVVHVLQRDSDSNYREKSSFSTWGAEGFKWSSDQKKLLTFFDNGFQSWLINSEGSYGFFKGKDSRSYGLSFLKDSKTGIENLIYLDTDGLLWMQSEDQREADISLEIRFKLPSQTYLLANESITAIAPGEVAVGFGSEMNIYGMREGKLVLAEKSALTLPRDALLADLRYAEEELSFRTQNGVYCFKKIDMKWISSCHLKILDSEISSAVVLRDRIVTVDSSQRRKRYWEKKSSLQGFNTNSDRSYFFNWYDENSLIIAGSGKGFEIWSLSGEKLGILAHKIDTTQVISNLFWNADRTRKATVEEDGRILLYDQNGKVVNEMMTQAVGPGLAHRYGNGVFSANGKKIMTSFGGQINIWQEVGADSFQPLEGVAPIDSPEKLILYPISLRKFTWNDSEIVMFISRSRIKNLYFYDFEGNTRKDIWSNDSKSIAADLSPDGRSLAVATTDKELKVYRLGTDGFNTSVSAVQGIPEGTLSNLLWSPDGKYLAGIFLSDRIVIWRYEDGKLVKKGERPISTLEGDNYQPIWTNSGFIMQQLNVIYHYNYDLEIISEWKPFDEGSTITSMTYNYTSDVLAVNSFGDVRLISVHEKNVALKICDQLRDYFATSNEFGRVDDLSEHDRGLCGPVITPK